MMERIEPDLGQKLTEYTFFFFFLLLSFGKNAIKNMNFQIVNDLILNFQSVNLNPKVFVDFMIKWLSYVDYAI